MFIKSLLISLNLVASLPLYSFTLISDPPARFFDSNITFNVSNNDCVNAGLTVYEVLDLAEEAANRFWNKAPTSSLNLQRGGVVSEDFSADIYSEAREKVTDGTITIGCSSNDTEFTSVSTVGKGGISVSGTSVKGLVLLNDIAGTRVATLPRDTLLALLAHEIGHTLGLHHSSLEEALMYYSISGTVPMKLHQDDIDGITYLYPLDKKMGGLLGSCGTIDKNVENGENFPGEVFLGMTVALIFFFGIKRVAQKVGDIFLTF